MKATHFAQANIVLGKPEGMTDKECGELPAYRGKTSAGHPVFISCFEMTDEELLKVIETKKIWLHVNSEQHPPVALTPHAPTWINEG